MGERRIPRWARKEALRNRYLDRTPLHRHLVAEIFDLTGELHAAGYVIGQKPEYRGKSKFLKRFSKFTTVFPVGDLFGGDNVLALGCDYRERSDVAKVALLRHELVHVRQSRRMGGWIFALRYLTSSSWRWAFEMQAYRQSLVTLRLAGVSSHERKRQADWIARTIRSAYSLKRFSQNEVARNTALVLATELED